MTPPNDDKSNSRKRNVIAILTLRRHETGIWIQRLVDCLNDRLVGSDIVPQIIVLENTLQQPFSVSDDSSDCFLTQASRHWMGVVNRVSDAAEPWEVKACSAVLQLAKHVWNIPIFNGPDAYSLCVNKWCHHVVFTRAGLASPPTVVFLSSTNTTTSDDDDDESSQNVSSLAAKALVEQCQKQSTGPSHHSGPSHDTHSFDMLIKPNAGGFGAGIQRRSLEEVDRGTNLISMAPPCPVFADHMTLLQRYISPSQGKVCRIWFLLGKIHCAVERSIETFVSSDLTARSASSSTDEFTSACVGGMCTRPISRKDGYCEHQPSSDINNQGPTGSTMKPWAVPRDVRIEIEEQLLPSLPADAHCGSVEFLHDERGRRLYFDLNLLSTLPLQNIANEADPWSQLAEAVLSVFTVA